ncbi:MAG: aminoacyl--tRNA ligase-related protein [Patescibacteria group bacterium]
MVIMLQSHLFTKTRKETPKDEVSKNALLLIQAGFIHKEMAGVYSYLPLGLRVFNKICNIIREEVEAIGGQEVFLTVFQDKAVWEKTGRWSDELVDNWFKTESKYGGQQYGLGFTHEEPLTALVKDYVQSYRDLPIAIYQIQTKFRDEKRPKSGVMRGREFVMKDLYSFSRTEEEHNIFYEKAKQAYTNIFKRVGLGDKTHLTFSSGGTFSKYSHEFQTESESGEDIIYVDTKSGLAVNKEVLNDEVLKDLGLSRDALIEKKAVEVGNIFSLGTRFSEPFELVYSDEKGEKKPVIMGSYGIGPGRVMGVVVETLSDDKGIIWPASITPFHVHLLRLGDKKEVVEASEKTITLLEQAGIEVLYDDRDVSAGEKFADSDLLGIPARFVISDRMVAEGKIEVKMRKDGVVTTIDNSSLSLEYLNQLKDL